MVGLSGSSALSDCGTGAFGLGPAALVIDFRLRKNLAMFRAMPLT